MEEEDEPCQQSFHCIFHRYDNKGKSNSSLGVDWNHIRFTWTVAQIMLKAGTGLMICVVHMFTPEDWERMGWGSTNGAKSMSKNKPKESKNKLKNTIKNAACSCHNQLGITPLCWLSRLQLKVQHISKYANINVVNVNALQLCFAFACCCLSSKIFHFLINNSWKKELMNVMFLCKCQAVFPWFYESNKPHDALLIQKCIVEKALFNTMPSSHFRTVTWFFFSLYFFVLHTLKMNWLTCSKHYWFWFDFNESSDISEQGCILLMCCRVRFIFRFYKTVTIWYNPVKFFLSFFFLLIN